jgi:hypothetical protein
MWQIPKLLVELAAMAGVFLIGLNCAVAEVPDSAVSLPGKPCRVEPLGKWTPQEKWVWQTVCEGNVANLVEWFEVSKDPSKAQDSTEARTLTSRFIETILLYEPFRLALPRTGVRIRGARITECLDLNGAKVTQEFWLDDSFLANGVDLKNAHFADRLTFDDTRSPTKFDLSGIRVDKELSMRGAKLGPVDLSDARVGENLLMSDATFSEVVLQNAKVVGRLEINKSTVIEMLDMNSLQVGGHLFMREGNFLRS